MTETRTVELYEDNAGGLYAIVAGEEEGFIGFEHVGEGMFASDAQAMLDGDTNTFTLERVSREQIEDLASHPETDLIAVYENNEVAITSEYGPGFAGSRYIGIREESEEEVFENPV